MKKKTIILGILLITAVSLMAYSTYAFFSSEEKVTNVFNVGKTKIDLTEPSWDDTTDGKNMLPGTDLVKDPTLVGLEGKSYARLVIDFVDENDNPITDIDRASAINNTIFYDSTYNVNNTPKTNVLTEGTSFTSATLNTMLGTSTIKKYNDTVFTLDTTRSTTSHYVYNYNSILNPNETMVLFTNVIVPTDYEQAEMNKLGIYKIKVSAEAIQSEGFNNSDDAFKQLDKEV